MSDSNDENKCAYIGRGMVEVCGAPPESHGPVIWYHRFVRPTPPGPKEYVVGFLFDTSRTQVVLVKKNRPPWQAGKYNGVGGKIEPGESPAQAMRREFVEETGELRNDWELFCILGDSKFKVYFYRAFEVCWLRGKVSTKTDEQISVVPIHAVSQSNSIPNLTWLIPMALSMENDAADSFVVAEIRAKD